MDREIGPEHLLDRGARLDVLARTETGILINIEVQVANQYNIDKRSLYYWAALYHGQLGSGQKFGSLKKTITINVLEFDWFKDERYRHVFHLREESGEKLNDDLEMHFLELKKLRNISHQPEERLEAWLMYLNNVQGEALEVIAMENPGIRKALTIEELFWKSDKERRIYELREKALKDEISALDGAKAEGRAEGRHEAICKYLEVRFGEESRELQHRVEEIESLTELDGIINRIYLANGLQEAEQVVFPQQKD
jgi:predicted transposase/invertase (TIGR01784 family)